VTNDALLEARKTVASAISFKTEDETSIPACARALSSDQPSPRRRKGRLLCGAKTRAGGCCQVRAEPGKRRCRFHGGKSTGPKTQAGRARIAEAPDLKLPLPILTCSGDPASSRRLVEQNDVAITEGPRFGEVQR
jgi:hypothetical protein